MAQLTDELARRGLRGRGRRDYPEKPLTVSAVADLLANPIYLGMVEWEGITYPGQHQPLVSADTFHRVQRLLAARAVRGTRDRRHHHELKGVLWCGVCGRRLSLTLAKQRYLYYYCLGQKNQARTGCRETYVPADLLETAVERLYQQVQLPPDWLDKLRTALDAEITSRQDRNARERQLLTRRMAKLEAERRKLLDAYYAGAVDIAVLRAEQQRIGGELRTAEQRLAAVDATLMQRREVLETAMRFAANCGQAYRSASSKTRRLFNAAVFDRIEVGQMSTIIRLQGMHAATTSTVGWVQSHDTGPECLFCGQPASLFKPVDRGPRRVSGRLWWCPPCDTTWLTS